MFACYLKEFQDNCQGQADTQDNNAEEVREELMRSTEKRSNCLLMYCITDVMAVERKNKNKYFSNDQPNINLGEKELHFLGLGQDNHQGRASAHAAGQEKDRQDG